jgi:type VI protein secretion system component VasK
MDGKQTTREHSSKSWLRQKWEERKPGVLDNVTYDLLKLIAKILLGFIALAVLWLISQTLPILQQHVWSFKISINIGIIIITGLLVLGAVLLIHKYQEKANKRKKERKAEITEYNQKVVELEEQLAEKVRLIDQFYKDQEANSKIINRSSCNSSDKELDG